MSFLRLTQPVFRTATNPMTAHERDLNREGFAIWLEEQERPRREKEELWAAIAELQSRLAEVELRLDDLDALPEEASE